MKYSWSCSFCVSPASTTDWSCALPPWNNFEGGASAKAKPLSSWESLWGAFSFSLSWVTLLYEYFCIRRLFTPSSGNKGGIFATTWLTPAGSPLSLRSTIPPLATTMIQGLHANHAMSCSRDFCMLPTSSSKPKTSVPLFRAACACKNTAR